MSDEHDRADAPHPDPSDEPADDDRADDDVASAPPTESGHSRATTQIQRNIEDESPA